SSVIKFRYQVPLSSSVIKFRYQVLCQPPEVCVLPMRTKSLGHVRVLMAPTPWWPHASFVCAPLQALSALPTRAAARGRGFGCCRLVEGTGAKRRRAKGKPGAKVSSGKDGFEVPAFNAREKPQ